MNKSKKLISVISAVLAVVVIMTGFTACKKEETPESDINYLTNVNQYSFWSNTADTAIAEYNTYNHVHSFLDECEIVIVIFYR